MGFNRFQFIRANLSFSDDSKNKNVSLHKIREFIDHNFKKWEENYYPGRDLSIDETLLAYRGHKFRYKVCITTKPKTQGILMYALAESNTGYMLKGELFGGVEDVDNKIPNRNLEIIKRLLKNYLDKGHRVFMDNYYTSVTIVNYLYSKNTGCIGTFRTNRVGDIGLSNKMVKGDIRTFQNEKFKHILLTIWWDSVITRVLSNCSKIDTVLQKRDYHFYHCFRNSPLVFYAYNQKARGVDINNHYIAKIRYLLKAGKWWNIVFYQFLHICIVNAFIIYKYNLFKEKKHKKPLVRKMFILSIARYLLSSNGPVKFENEKKYYLKAQGYDWNDEVRLVHFPQICSLKRVCKLKKTNDKCKGISKYYCRDCGDGKTEHYLCYPDCFEIYHKQLFSNK